MRPVPAGVHRPSHPVDVGTTLARRHARIRVAGRGGGGGGNGWCPKLGADGSRGCGDRQTPEGTRTMAGPRGGTVPRRWNVRRPVPPPQDAPPFIPHAAWVAGARARGEPVDTVGTEGRGPAACLAFAATRRPRAADRGPSRPSQKGVPPRDGGPVRASRPEGTGETARGLAPQSPHAWATHGRRRNSFTLWAGGRLPRTPRSPTEAWRACWPRPRSAAPRRAAVGLPGRC